MPAAIRNMKIVGVSSSGIVLTGDAPFLAPSSKNKLFSGSGSYSTGDNPWSNVILNATSTQDADVMDGVIIKRGLT